MVTAAGHVVQDSWVIFTDGDGIVHQVRADDVKRITRGDVPEPKAPAPAIA
jgi:hypothetical protein